MKLFLLFSIGQAVLNPDCLDQEKAQECGDDCTEVFLDCLVACGSDNNCIMQCSRDSGILQPNLESSPSHTYPIISDRQRQRKWRKNFPFRFPKPVVNIEKKRKLKLKKSKS